MGRAGGGGGGSHHSGGSFGGGSHHSGGFSGGGHSASGGGRPSGGSYHHSSMNSRPSGGHYYGGYYDGPRRPRSSRYRYEERHVVVHRHMSPMETIVSMFVTMFIVFMFIFIIGISTQNTYQGYEITKSQVEREKLSSSNLIETDYFADEAGYIYDSRKLEQGMKSFYKETGVQPYLYISDNIDGDTMPTASMLEAKGEELYSELFDDECHFLFIFVDSVDLENAGQDFVAWYVVGDEARLVMDDEACQIFADYVKAYYYSSSFADWEDFLSEAYSDTGSRIMSVYTNPWIYVCGLSAVSVIVIVGYVWWTKKRQAKKEEEEATERILNTPLESFSSDAASDLAKKYEEQDTNKSQET